MTMTQDAPVTKRDYLVSLGLAKANSRGRFSFAAQDALNKAIESGTVFADDATPTTKPVVISKAKKVAMPNKPYDAKKVRDWALRIGREVSQRGRISADTVVAYFEANPEAETVTESNQPEKRVVKSTQTVTPAVMPKRERVRPENEAWGVSQRKPGDPSYISEPLVAISNCGRCEAGIGYCNCSGGPYLPAYLSNTGKADQPASLTKPVA